MAIATRKRKRYVTMRTGRLPINTLHAAGAPARAITKYAPRLAFSALNAMTRSYPFSRNLLKSWRWSRGYLSSRNRLTQ